MNFPNIGNIYKCVNIVRKWDNRSTWDFSLRQKHSYCFFSFLTRRDTSKNNPVHNMHVFYKAYKLLIPNPSETNCTLYGNKPTEDVSREEVCSMFERYADFKLKQYTKWKNYEYEKFGKAVTDKRGICI